MNKRRILVFIDWFDPGYKAGGPIRSAVNFVKHMQQDYEVYVFTTDRDLGTVQPYENITTDAWITYNGEVKVYYASPAQLSFVAIGRMLQQVQPHHIYLNSMYSRFFTIYPLLLAKQHGWKCNLVLAPRGMLKQSAVQFKSRKKRIFLKLFRLIGLHKHITFQATDQTEYSDIQKYFGTGVRVVHAANFPGYIAPYPGSILKKQGELRIIFIGRVHPIKNLDYLIQALAGVAGTVLLTVIGSAEDKGYQQRCKELAASLPANISVAFKGEIPNKELPAIIEEHHIFGLPTKGENFGHAIFEALALAKPVLISDQTPWRQLQQAKAGWDLALPRPELFTQAIQQAVEMDQTAYDEWTKGAWEFVTARISANKLKEKYYHLFNW